MADKYSKIRYPCFILVCNQQGAAECKNIPCWALGGKQTVKISALPWNKVPKYSSKVYNNNGMPLYEEAMYT